MRNIIIVEAVSTGYNFVEDAVRRGYNPIVMEISNNNHDDIENVRAKCYASCYRRPEIIRSFDDYDKTYELVKSYDPVLVLAGSEFGVVLATRLADDLGLTCNPYSNIASMTRKDAMHEALAKAGIRHIRGKVVNSPEEAVAFCKDNELNTAVIKPLQSAGSNGLFLCDDLDEVRRAAETVVTWKDYRGLKIDSFLVQERIVGDEYIVNTVSCNGDHRLNSIMRYGKLKTPEGGYIYDYAESISHLEPGHTALIEYAYKVADAIEIKYGMIHGEYMIDANGPVLIEVNCRPMGCTMSDEYLDLIYGQHESDTMLDSFLDPEGFALKKDLPYRPLRKGVLKLIMVPEDIEVEDHPIYVVARQLKSAYKITSGRSEMPVFYKKTRDLDSAGGIIYLVHDDENVVKRDLELLRRIEKNYFSFILSSGMSRRWFRDVTIEKPDVKKILKECNCHGATLFAGDYVEEIEGIQCVCPDTVDNANKGFDNVIVAFHNSLLRLKESECLELIFRTIDKVKPGGRVIIPESSYEYLSYKKEGAELLMEIKGLELVAPGVNLADYVIGKAR